MTNVEKLKNSSALQVLRMRLGSEKGTDDFYDELINDMDKDTLVSEYCAYYNGDKYLWKTLKDLYDKL